MRLRGLRATGFAKSGAGDGASALLPVSNVSMSTAPVGSHVPSQGSHVPSLHALGEHGPRPLTTCSRPRCRGNRRPCGPHGAGRPQAGHPGSTAGPSAPLAAWAFTPGDPWRGDAAVCVGVRWKARTQRGLDQSRL